LSALSVVAVLIGDPPSKPHWSLTRQLFCFLLAYLWQSDQYQCW